MTITRWRVLVLVLVLSLTISLIPLQTAYAAGIIETKLNWRTDRDIKRFKNIGTNEVMELLAIKPGMTVLDIGTGTSQFVYEFANKLKGTGKVFATDVDSTCIAYIKEEAGKRGLSNLYPVLVKREGLDDFYGKHKYDLITLFHVFKTYEGRVDYLKKMRGFLSEEGRLILIFYKKFPPFSLNDFTGDFKGLARELSLEPVDSPFYKSLRQSTRRLIKQNSGAEPDEYLKQAIVEDFNRILADNHFGSNFIKNSAFKKELAFSPEERTFADWSLLSVIYKNIFSRKLLRAEELQYIAQINKLLIIQKFRPYLHKDKMFTSENAGKIKVNVEKAGYKLQKEYNNAIPFEDILVFTADKSAGK